MAAHEKLATQFEAIFHPAEPKSMDRRPTHRLEAWAPEHAETDWAKTHPADRTVWEGSSADPGIRPMGAISWHHKTGEIMGVFTAPEHQRQGVASALHQKAHEIAGETRGVPLPRHSSFRTRSGDAWARSVGGRLPKLNVK